MVSKKEASVRDMLERSADKLIELADEWDDLSDRGDHYFTHVKLLFKCRILMVNIADLEEVVLRFKNE